MLVPPLVVTTIWAGLPNSALARTPSARISEMDSVEGKASKMKLPPVAFFR